MHCLTFDDNWSMFLQAGYPSCHPFVRSVKTLKENICHTICSSTAVLCFAYEIQPARLFTHVSYVERNDQ